MRGLNKNIENKTKDYHDGMMIQLTSELVKLKKKTTSLKDIILMNND